MFVGLIVLCAAYVSIKFGFLPILFSLVGSFLPSFIIALVGALLIHLTARSREWYYPEQIHPPAIALSWLVGALLGGIGFAIVVSTFATTEAQFSLMIASPPDCSRDRHQCLGNGLFEMGFIIFCFFTSIPGALLGGEIARRNYVHGFQKLRSRR
ncbi:hypothetical protein LEP3755_38550 [Leptolyngbya sp. NIES-3755]|nr:hypothetical protein LEP3755_38550 [Leptolyngbya sp. NIES-3755]